MKKNYVEQDGCWNCNHVFDGMTSYCAEGCAARPIQLTHDTPTSYQRRIRRWIDTIAKNENEVCESGKCDDWIE